MKRLASMMVMVVGLSACPAFPSGDLCDQKGVACADGGMGEGGGSDGGADGAPDAPPGCDLGKEPKDSPACVSDAVGVFVSPMGIDTNPGTKQSPVKSIGKALSLVGSKPRVYVCEGTYAEDVVLDASHDGVSIYGGWSCNGWSYTGGKPVVGKTQRALVLDGLGKPVVIADVAARAADGDAPL